MCVHVYMLYLLMTAESRDACWPCRACLVTFEGPDCTMLGRLTAPGLHDASRACRAGLREACGFCAALVVDETRLSSSLSPPSLSLFSPPFPPLPCFLLLLIVSCHRGKRILYPAPIEEVISSGFFMSLSSTLKFYMCIRANNYHQCDTEGWTYPVYFMRGASQCGIYQTRQRTYRAEYILPTR